jgi:hypothetical protein
MHAPRKRRDNPLRTINTNSLTLAHGWEVWGFVASPTRRVGLTAFEGCGPGTFAGYRGPGAVRGPATVAFGADGLGAAFYVRGVGGTGAGDGGAARGGAFAGFDADAWGG